MNSQIAELKPQIVYGKKEIDELTSEFRKGHIETRKDRLARGDVIVDVTEKETLVWVRDDKTPLSRKLAERIFDRKADKARRYSQEPNMAFSVSQFDDFLVKLFKHSTTKQRIDSTEFIQKMFGDSTKGSKISDLFSDVKAISDEYFDPMSASRGSEQVLSKLDDVVDKKVATDSKVVQDTMNQAQKNIDNARTLSNEFIQEYGAPYQDFSFYYHKLKRPAGMGMYSFEAGVAGEQAIGGLPFASAEAQPEVAVPTEPVPIDVGATVTPPAEIPALTQIQPQLTGDISAFRITPVGGLDLSQRSFVGMDSGQLYSAAQLEAMRQAERLATKQAMVPRATMAYPPAETYRMPPRIPAYPTPITMPIIPPFGASTRKPRRSRTRKQQKMAIWWNVPSQPLGEAWSPLDYQVIGFAGKPAETQFIREREAQLGLDTYKEGIFGKTSKFDSWRFSPLGGGRLVGGIRKSKKQLEMEAKREASGKAKAKKVKVMKAKIKEKSTKKLWHISSTDPVL